MAKFTRKLVKVRNLIRNPNQNESDAARHRYKEMLAGRRKAMSGARAKVRVAQFAAGQGARLKAKAGPKYGPKAPKAAAKAKVPKAPTIKAKGGKGGKGAKSGKSGGGG